uniref:Immunoglobulin V-set domain-containing protein n=1 Tax=Sparus aurata TaxID=8175 RepID=A0A671XLI5_SPAAU
MQVSLCVYWTHNASVYLICVNSYTYLWNVNVTRHIKATLGKDVTIPCTFTYPPKLHTDNIKVYWKKMKAGECPSTTADKNQNIFDSENKCLLPEYKGRTKLIGDIKSKNCTLLIRNIAANEDNIYVRIIALEPYSFKKHTVSISVDVMLALYLTPQVTWSRSETVMLQSEKLNDQKWTTRSTLTFDPQSADLTQPLNCTVQHRGRELVKISHPWFLMPAPFVHLYIYTISQLRNTEHFTAHCDVTSVTYDQLFPTSDLVCRWRSEQISFQRCFTSCIKLH